MEKVYYKLDHNLRWKNYIVQSVYIIYFILQSITYIHIVTSRNKKMILRCYRKRKIFR